MSTHDGHENEIKLPLESVKSGRDLLRRAGFRISKRRVLERNTVFDTPELTLRSAESLLRVRQAGRTATLTYKGPPVQSKHKLREELELKIPDAQGMAAIIGRLGFRPVFRYEKYRTEYRAPSAEGVATLDETPIGIYMELEGPPDWVDRTAREMGFAESDYITASYAGLYTEWSRRHGVEPTDMVFG